MVYKNGDILLMSGDSAEYAECVVTDGEVIVYVGDVSGAGEVFVAVRLPCMSVCKVLFHSSRLMIMGVRVRVCGGRVMFE